MLQIKKKTANLWEYKMPILCVCGKTDCPQFKKTSCTFRVFTNRQNWQYWHYCQLYIPRNLQFSSLFALHVASKCKIRYH